MPSLEDTRLQAELGRLQMTREFWKTLESLVSLKPREWRICAQYAFVKESAYTMREKLSTIPQRVPEQKMPATVPATTPAVSIPPERLPALETRPGAEMATVEERRMQQYLVEGAMKLSMLSPTQKQEKLGSMIDESQELTTDTLNKNATSIYSGLAAVPIDREVLPRNFQLLIAHTNDKKEMSQEEIMEAGYQAISHIEASIHKTPGIRGIEGEKIYHADAGNINAALYAAAIASTPNFEALPPPLQEGLKDFDLQDGYDGADHEQRGEMLKEVMLSQPDLQPHIVRALAESLKKVSFAVPVPPAPREALQKEKVRTPPKKVEAAPPPEQPPERGGAEEEEMELAMMEERRTRMTFMGGMVKSTKRAYWLLAAAGAGGAAAFLGGIAGASHINNLNAAETSLFMIKMIASHIFHLIV